MLAPTGCLVGRQSRLDEPRARSAAQPRRPRRLEVAGRSTSRLRPTRGRARRPSSTSTASSRSCSIETAVATGSRERPRTGSRSSTATASWVWQPLRRDPARAIVCRSCAAASSASRSEVDAAAARRAVLERPTSALASRTMSAGAGRVRRLLHGRRLAAREGPAPLRRARGSRRRRASRRSRELRSSGSTPTSAAEARLHGDRRSTPSRSRSGGRRAASRSSHCRPSTAARAGYAHVPDAVLHTNDREIYAAFVRGLFEADGTTSERLRDVGAPSPRASAATSRHCSSRSGSSPRARSTAPVRTGTRTTASSCACSTSHRRSASSTRSTSSPSGRPRRSGRASIRQASRHDHIPVGRELVDELAPENDALPQDDAHGALRAAATSRGARPPRCWSAPPAPSSSSCSASTTTRWRRSRFSTTSRRTTCPFRRTSPTSPTASSATTRSAS